MLSVRVTDYPLVVQELLSILTEQLWLCSPHSVSELFEEVFDDYLVIQADVLLHYPPLAASLMIYDLEQGLALAKVVPYVGLLIIQQQDE